MGGELVGVAMGGALAIASSVLTTFAFRRWEFAQKRRFVSVLVQAELVAIKEKCERYLANRSDERAFQSSTPLWSAHFEPGYLSPDQAIASRRCVVLDMEARAQINTAKIDQCLAACKNALALF